MRFSAYVVTIGMLATVQPALANKCSRFQIAYEADMLRPSEREHLFAFLKRAYLIWPETTPFIERIEVRNMARHPDFQEGNISRMVATATPPQAIDLVPELNNRNLSGAKKAALEHEIAHLLLEQYWNFNLNPRTKTVLEKLDGMWLMGERWIEYDDLSLSSWGDGDLLITSTPTMRPSAQPIRLQRAGTLISAVHEFFAYLLPRMIARDPERGVMQLSKFFRVQGIDTPADAHLLSADDDIPFDFMLDEGSGLGDIAEHLAFAPVAHLYWQQSLDRGRFSGNGTEELEMLLKTLTNFIDSYATTVAEHPKDILYWRHQLALELGLD